MDQIHNKIRALRQRRKVSVDTLAKAINLTKASISRLERGIIPATLAHQQAIADYFGITVEQLQEVELTSEENYHQALAQKDEEITRMRKATDQFLEEQLKFHLEELAKVNPEEIQEKAHIRLFESPGVAYLFASGCVSPENQLLAEFKIYLKFQAAKLFIEGLKEWAINPYKYLKLTESQTSTKNPPTSEK